jgi:transposase
MGSQDAAAAPPRLSCGQSCPRGWCAVKLAPYRIIPSTLYAILKERIAFHESLPSLVRATAEGQRKRRGRPRRRTGHNLLLPLSTRKEDVLRFLTDPDVPFTYNQVPFTNNQAEQDGRMMKVKQKISGGFRSEDGANTFVVNRSVISTAKKQGWNILKALTQDPNALIQSLRLA